MDQVIEWRGKPLVLRCDSDPEYVSDELKTRTEKRGMRLDFIQPGNPQQNAYIERYNRTVRYDWLSHYLFESIDQVQRYATRWLWTYNNDRPNTAIGSITPNQKLALAAQFPLLNSAKNGRLPLQRARTQIVKRKLLKVSLQ